MLAGLLGLYAPGLGHLYAGEPETGLLIAGTAMVSIGVLARYGFDPCHSGFGCLPNRIGVITLITGLGALIYGVADAPSAAVRFNRRHAARSKAPSNAVLAPALVGPPGHTHLGLSLRLTR